MRRPAVWIPRQIVAIGGRRTAEQVVAPRNLSDSLVLFEAGETTGHNWQTIWIVPLILYRRICSFFAIGASYEDSCSGYTFFGHVYSPTLVITPEPTVLPPSRMAKRSPSSSAIGTMSLADILAWSPGITISMPFGSSIEPVISVVFI